MAATVQVKARPVDRANEEEVRLVRHRGAGREAEAAGGA